MAKKQAKPKKFKSLHEAYVRADGGDVLAQRCIVGTLRNLGCEHLARKVLDDDPKWLTHWRGFQQYLMALVGEYGESEAAAERELLAELNNSFSYADNVEL